MPTKTLTPFTLALLPLLWAAPAPAEPGQNIQIPINIAVPNPCVPEFVVLTGDLHILLHINANEGGGSNFVFHSNYQGIEGVGLTTGSQYRGVNTQTLKVELGSGGLPSVFTNVVDIRLIGQGQTENFVVHLTQHITVNENGEITAIVDNATTECRG
ncbi:hypothetical protein [Sorangium sp. So ce1078]|uniref:hypothetical protein n=1 Tax=Sorangium sp. So ce1078 TaxID=3133329 RepID=UPI003F5D69AA